MSLLSPESTLHFMNRALELADRAQAYDEVPIGAVIVDEDANVLGEGFNQREDLRRTAAHAEMLALEAFNATQRTWRLPPGSSLFVTLEPCLMCVGAFLWARVDYIYYGASDPKCAGLERVKNLIDSGVFDHKVKGIFSGVFAEQSASKLSGYFQFKREEKRTHRHPAHTEMASSFGISHAE